jgi:hypothetical protein
MSEEKEIPLIEEETPVEFSRYEQLSYKDYGDAEVELFVDDKLVGLIYVWKDSLMDMREYVCINYEIVYLDELTERK